MHLANPPAPRAPLKVGSLVLSPASREAHWGEHPLGLTGTEFDLLYLLAENAGVPVSKSVLGERVFDKPWHTCDRSIAAHLSNVRRKLRACTQEAVRIEGLRRRGYQYCPESPPVPLTLETPAMNTDARSPVTHWRGRYLRAQRRIAVLARGETEPTAEPKRNQVPGPDPTHLRPDNWLEVLQRLGALDARAVADLEHSRELVLELVAELEEALDMLMNLALDENDYEAQLALVSGRIGRLATQVCILSGGAARAAYDTLSPELRSVIREVYRLHPAG